MATSKKKGKKNTKANGSFTFMSKSGTEKSIIDAPKNDCKAQQVVMGVLNMGAKPEDTELRFAKSYGAHYVQRKGKNALGFFDTKDVLVVNGIASELEKAGVKGIMKPSKSKNYKAIKLTEVSDKDLKDLIVKIARVLGFGSKGKASSTAPAEAGA